MFSQIQALSWSSSYVVVLLLTAVSGDPVPSYSALDRVSQDDLLTTALLLYPHTEHPDMTITFPSMSFICSGVIQKVFLVAKEANGPEAPVFQLQTEGMNLLISHPLINLVEVVRNNMTGIALYECETNISYSLNYNFSFYQPPLSASQVVLQYQQGGGPMGNVLNNIQTSLQDNPLVAVQASNPECVVGFLERKALELVVNNHLVISSSVVSSDSQLQLFPDINFTCAGTITRLTVGVAVEQNGLTSLSKLPQIQLWKLVEGSENNYTLAKSFPSLSSLKQVPFQAGVYTMEVNVEFRSGDTLGVVHPLSSRVHIHSLANKGPDIYTEPLQFQLQVIVPTSFVLDNKTGNQWPLVTVETAEDCARGFIGRDILQLAEARVAFNSPASSMRAVVPELKFTTSGLLTKWIFAAQYTTIFNSAYPHFQVWRKTGSTFTAVEGTTTSSSLPSRSTFLNVYEYFLEPPVPVEAGDFVGMVVPGSNDGRLKLSIIRGVGYDIHTVNGQSGNVIFLTTAGPPSIPQINVELLVNTTTTTKTIVSMASFSSSVSPSSPATFLPTTTTASSGGSISTASLGDSIGVVQVGIIIGAILGLILCILAVLIAVLCLYLITKRRKEQRKEGERRSSEIERELENPIFSNLSDGYATPILHQTSPLPSHSSYSSSLLPSSSSPLPLLHQYHTLIEPQPASHYLEPTTTRREQSPLPPVGVAGVNIYSELTLERKASKHDYHELDPAGGYYRLYQEGIYVPTEEQRKLSENQKHVYVSLGECLYAPLSKGAGQRSLTFFEESEIYWKPASCTGSLYAQLAQKKYREIFEDQIKVLYTLGSGQFGEVNKGVWQSPHGPVEVAVKTLKREASEEDAIRFLQEAAIMGQFRHPNIVELLGVVTLGERVMIVLEYVSHGDLNSFLVNQRPIPGSQVPEGTEFRLLDFCKDVAHGMEYLQRKAFVHRDLAARNILVSKNNTCKIGDFGMSRDLLSESYYISKGGKVPIKWTAPEALNYNKYSTASDVWSFGVVMYEIWSLGHKPFENYTNLEVQQMILTGKRMAPPPGCPRGVYCLMIECWHPDDTCRPTFFGLLKTLTTSPSELLNWSAGDARGMPQVEALGGPLDASRNLFPDLQDIYYIT